MLKQQKGEVFVVESIILSLKILKMLEAISWFRKINLYFSVKKLKDQSLFCQSTCSKNSFTHYTELILGSIDVTIPYVSYIYCLIDYLLPLIHFYVSL